MKAIDVHGHFGPYDRGLGTRVDTFMSATADEVAQRGLDSEIEITVVSAIHGLIPYRGNAVLGNRDAALAVESNPALRFWTIVDPRVPESYEQSDELLDHSGCVGIKIHPHAHGYEIREHGPALFAFAAERDAVVLAHSGDIGSYPEDFVAFVDRYPNIQLILAHLGNSDDGSISRQVEAIERARNGNLWVDTSSSRSMFAGLIEWAVERIGYERILFGSDTPLYWAGAQKGRIETAEIDEAAKLAILWNNAAGLLGLGN
jgi:predicted TIM-barrel fold metal-dependent hydrolase